FPDEDAPGDTGTSLHGYRVLKSLHFGGAGGTYLAERESDGTQVVLKEARPHTAFADDGSDGQERLRREYEALRLLADTGIAPRPIELFTEWEHLFLAQEYLADTIALVHLVAKFNPLPRNDWREGRAEAYRRTMDKVLDGVRAAIDACHERGLVYGDLSLTNVLINPETLRVWLVDFESSRPLGARQDLLPRTPGFAPSRSSAAAADGRSFDHFGLAAVELALLMPRNTLRALDPAALARATAHSAGLLGRPVDDLFRRLDLPTDVGQLDPATVPAEAMRFAEAVMTPDRADRLFPADPAVYRTNPWSVAYGAAGVLRALHRITGRFPEPVRDWMGRTTLDGVPPGLYHGLAGVGWTLCDAGEPQWGAEIVQRAVSAADGVSLPADVLSGRAGLGLACLAVWSGTGDTTFLDHAARIGDDLAATARDNGFGLYWPDSAGGAVPVGYGHGSAGVAMFLLYLHLATGNRSYLRIGRRALQHDLAEGVAQEDGVLAFPARSGRRVFYPYWQRGAAGVATALARYCRVLDDPSLHDTLRRIVSHDIGGVSISTGLFTGMCGPGNLALDYAELFDVPEYVPVAQRLGRAAVAMASVQPEGVAFAGDSLLRFSTDFATGSAGTALFLHRAFAGGGDFNSTLDHLLPARTPMAERGERAGQLAGAGVTGGA
ncbi:MAG TPA: lanthionine synthetase LanC family protein, partial [Micromonospora sp.]